MALVAEKQQACQSLQKRSPFMCVCVFVQPCGPWSAGKFRQFRMVRMWSHNLCACAYLSHNNVVGSLTLSRLTPEIEHECWWLWGLYSVTETHAVGCCRRCRPQPSLDPAHGRHLSVDRWPSRTGVRCSCRSRPNCCDAFVTDRFRVL